MFICSSPEPQKSKSRKRKQAPAEDSKAAPEEPPEAKAADADAPADEADDAFHAAAADLFREWLAQHKAQLAEDAEASIQAHVFPLPLPLYHDPFLSEVQRHQQMLSTRKMQC